MARKRIILVEDERDMADLVARRLQREHYDVEVAHDGVSGLDKIRCRRPDLVLLTARTEDADVVVGLELGADDYVTKPFSMSVLLARVAAVLRRSDGPIVGKGMLTAGPLRIDQEQHRVEVKGQPVALTATEFRLLVAIAAARGRVLSRDQLIDQALGTDAVVTDRTIDVHMASLRKKLGAARELLGTVRGVGYRLAREADAS